MSLIVGNDDREGWRERLSREPGDSRHKSPIPHAGRLVERIPVVATDVQPIGSDVSNARGLDHTLTH